MTLSEEMNDAIIYGEPFLAYTIFYASQQGLSLDENFETLKTMNIDFDEVKKLVELDPLRINEVKLYSSKTKEGKFHLVLAKSKSDATQEMFKYTNERINDVRDVSHGMDEVLWDIEKNKSEYVWQTKDSIMEFPHYIGLLERGG